QNVLATFLGSFLYSLVGIIALNTDLYGERGRAMLFLVTLGVILIIVVTLLRWIEHLASLGRVDETSRRIEEAAQAAIVTRAKDPCMGGRPLPDGDHAIPASAVPFCSAITGYVQHVDMQMLARLADEEKADIYLSGLPGLLVHPARTLVWIDGKDVGGEKVEKIAASVCDAFAIGDQRTFDEDPRFGLVVLTEIASRALSPGINDPGTAIDVIGRLLRLLITWKSEQAEEAADPHWPRIWVPPLQLKDMFDDAFMPIARDGAPMVEVELRLLKSLLALSRLDDDYAASAVRLARVALLHAESKLGLEQEKSRLRAVVAEIEASA
ncbi:MAG: DUF2254 domain-containing protein, partial [Parvibaculum sp.]|nr:DUF2254 domain-containing protein [Parvibaculum sp.]